MKYAEILARLVETPEGCWEWTGAKLQSGYGSVRFEGRSRVVHRVTWEQTHGPVADGLQIDHLCRNRACANPSHLEPVTQAENLRRGRGVCALNALKTKCPKGHPLNEENTYVDPRGYRDCRICRARRRREFYVKERAAS